MRDNSGLLDPLRWLIFQLIFPSNHHEGVERQRPGQGTKAGLVVKICKTRENVCKNTLQIMLHGWGVICHCQHGKEESIANIAMDRLRLLCTKDSTLLGSSRGSW